VDTQLILVLNSGLNHGTFLHIAHEEVKFPSPGGDHQPSHWRFG